MEDYSLKIANSLVKLMKSQNLTNERLSELSGVAVRTINKFRSGTIKDPKLSTVIALCDVLNVSIDEMIDRDCCGIDETLMMNFHTLPERDKEIAKLLLSDTNKED